MWDLKNSQLKQVTAFYVHRFSICQQQNRIYPLHPVETCASRSRHQCNYRYLNSDQTPTSVPSGREDARSDLFRQVVCLPTPSNHCLRLPLSLYLHEGSYHEIPETPLIQPSFTVNDRPLCEAQSQTTVALSVSQLPST